MLLTELLTSISPYKIIMDKPSGFIADFTINKKDYQFSASNYSHSDGDIQEGAWAVWFKIKNIEFSEYGVTGTGSELQVFSTIIQILKDFISDRDIKQLVFSADEESRAKLYKRMVSRFVGEFKWNLKIRGSEFILTKHLTINS